MRKETATQFAIESDVKDALDAFKVQRKEEILVQLKKRRRQITNSEAIKYLLVLANRQRRENKKVAV